VQNLLAMSLRSSPAPRRALFLAAIMALSASVCLAAPVFKFPPGVDWNNASPEQIREAVFAAVKEDPENAVEIVKAAMEMVQQTGRFPNSGSADGKQVVDADDGVVTLPEVADQIAQGAIQANPAMAGQISQAVNSIVASAPVTTAPGSGQADGGSSGTTGNGGTDGGSGAGGGGSAPPALPGGFGGGGGGGSTSGGGNIYTN